MEPSETLASAKEKRANVESSPLPLQRALLSSAVSRKCGPSTPIPSWKMYDTPVQGFMEPLASDANPRLVLKEMAARQSRCPRSTVSARKLAAALWDMQGALNASCSPAKEKSKSRQRTGLSRSSDHLKSGEDSAKQDYGMSNHQRLSFADREGSSKQAKATKKSPKEAKSRSQSSPIPHEAEVPLPAVTDGAHSCGDHGSTLSSELVKVLNQIWSLEEQHSESSTLVVSLRSELRKTKSQIKELQKEQASYQQDLDVMNKRLSDERKRCMDEAEEAVQAAVKSFKEELEIERKSKVKLEAKHKKLSQEINEARKTLTKTIQDFEREQKARELMEDVCDELAREIGEDKAQVEELRRQSAKFREEVEEERRMLQMAEVWREERVHMKLAEARFELEEKNTSLDRLRSELEAFLRAKRSLDEGSKDRVKTCASNANESSLSGLHTAENFQGEAQPLQEEPSDSFFCQGQIREEVGALEGEDSPDDDLHSIELSRPSCSGSLEGLPPAQCSKSNREAMLNVKRSPKNALLFELPVNEAPNLKHGKQMGVDSSGKLIMAASIASETRDVNFQMSGVQSERGMKDWDLGKQPVVWSNESIPRTWNDNVKDGRGLNAQGRTFSGHADSLLRTGSDIKTNGAVPQAVLGLNAWGRSGFGHLNSSFKSGSKVEESGPTCGTHSNLETFELPRDNSPEYQDNVGMLSSYGQVVTYPSSPTRKWSHSLASPEPAKAAKVEEPFENKGGVYRDNSLKARLLEAKIESQQARARGRKTALVM